MLSKARDLTLSLLDRRAEFATIRPSEVAKAMAGGNEQSATAWRAQMPAVHDAVDRLLADGLVRLTWKGRELPRRDGPYRISKTRDRA
ncbi:DUF3253 domain-containing protein [Sphingomonas sp. AP4-R1]|uniref:DUF3253 domain-containing protein n=1 Tax=Sphingomonas sp. AP4-R1 TaxID=2735134 RepID=UPI0014934741|nr:DUF3253 domain-containing protein [Sphingomonas sp. AP4-R1]QJU60302.1 DUF3253 domain-containing protein [Sphingomonas sp. AP4-R1]